MTAPATSRDGWFATPALITGLPRGHRLLKEETFGPFASILTASDAADAVHQANDVGYGLVASVHTADLSEALGVADALDCGLVKINAPTTGVDFYAPFGGDKQSSFGPREQGKAAMDFYSSSQTVAFATLNKIGA